MLRLSELLFLSYASINNRFSSRNTQKNETETKERRMKYPDLNICCNVFKLNIKEGRWLKKCFGRWKKIRISFFMKPSHCASLRLWKKSFFSRVYLETCFEERWNFYSACLHKVLQPHNTSFVVHHDALRYKRLFSSSPHSIDRRNCLLCVFVFLPQNLFKHLITKTMWIFVQS